MLRITNFRVPVEEDRFLKKLVAKKLALKPGLIQEITIIRQALDARRKPRLSFVYTLDVSVKVAEGAIVAQLKDKNIQIKVPEAPEVMVKGKTPLRHRPVVVGLGPAGLFCAYELAKEGYEPIVFERGGNVDERTEKVQAFWQSGQLDPKCNMQFGEGGAGTFSDGKLTTRVNDPHMHYILSLFVEAGAGKDILYSHKPHIGTDVLRQVVKNLRNKIIELGGEIHFHSQVTDILTTHDHITEVMINDKDSIPCESLFMAIGHSARDTYEMLQHRKIAMTAKPFAIGVRIEHPQALIDQAQYGCCTRHEALGAADYALVYHDKRTGRTAYSFCMCPGGLVVASSSEPGGVVTNGMSLQARASGVANSAIVVNVTPEDFGSDLLGGIHFQRRYEALAYKLGGANYHAPVQKAGALLQNYGLQASHNSQFQLEPTYRPGVTEADLRQCLPSYVTETIAFALPEFGRKIKGFDHGEAWLTGVETRTSAPVRLLRGSDFQSVQMTGLYPIGEGAGYAGGIMSAALDGLNSARSFMSQYAAKRVGGK